MNIFPDTRVKNVFIDEDNLSVEIMDGRRIKVPLYQIQKELLQY